MQGAGERLNRSALKFLWGAREQGSDVRRASLKRQARRRIKNRVPMARQRYCFPAACCGPLLVI
jgi:hypothetical protein